MWGVRFEIMMSFHFLFRRIKELLNMTWFGTRTSVPLSNNIWWFTVSNAFEKSKKRPQGIRLLVKRGRKEEEAKEKEEEEGEEEEGEKGEAEEEKEKRKEGEKKEQKEEMKGKEECKEKGKKKRKGEKRRKRRWILAVIEARGSHPNLARGRGWRDLPASKTDRRFAWLSSRDQLSVNTKTVRFWKILLVQAERAY